MSDPTKSGQYASGDTIRSMPQNSPDPVQMSPFAHAVTMDRYSHTLPDGSKETWEQIAERVAAEVIGSVGGSRDEIDLVAGLIAARKFIPAGRYLHSSGLPYHQVNNCLLLKAEDTREGWGDLLRKAALAQMTGAGIGVDYSALREKDAPLKRGGGTSSGPLALMHMVNEVGRGARQGGTRRGAIWAGLNWKHPDIKEFIRCKDWSPEIRAMKAADFNASGFCDYTNISVGLDDEFFAAYAFDTHPRHELAHDVYWTVIRHMCRTGEPGFSVDVGADAGETLRNAPVCGETRVLTSDGYKTVEEIVGVPTALWTGVRWADACVFSRTAEMVPTVRVEMSNGQSIRCDPSHEFIKDFGQTDGEWYYARLPASALRSGMKLWTSMPDMGSRSPHIEVVAVHPDEPADVFCCDVRHPEHSFMAEGVLISNCTEITSRDDSDVCNLGHINMARVESLEEMAALVRVGIRFLLAGTVYSDLPYEKVHETRGKNRRLGLGLMGIGEWLAARGLAYGPDDDLEEYLKIYAGSGPVADQIADDMGLSRPVKTRAIAPTGTCSIVAETTSGMEPIFCAAYLRRWRVGDDWHEETVVDPVALRLLESGVDPAVIEDAYSLAPDIERRMAMQAWLQQFVDHGIASTINLPAWGSEHNNSRTATAFGDALIGYLPGLRGITAYPDGARNGQPLQAIPLEGALIAVGREDLVIEQGDVCDLRSGESCGG